MRSIGVAVFPFTAGPTAVGRDFLGAPFLGFPPFAAAALPVGFGAAAGNDVAKSTLRSDRVKRTKHDLPDIDGPWSLRRDQNEEGRRAARGEPKRRKRYDAPVQASIFEASEKLERFPKAAISMRRRRRKG